MDLDSLEIASNEPEDEYCHSSDVLIYTAANIPGTGSSESDFECQLGGCICADSSCNTPSCTCLSKFGSNYSKEGLLLSGKLEDTCVMECNDLCKCDFSCCNRVVQKGPRKFLEIFNCGSLKGLGLKTNHNIQKGSFICEYAGEVIGKAEAKKRYEVASLKGDMNYIFVLRENTSTDVLETIVDPTVIGNIGRYINHSCNPNSAIVPVRFNHAVPKLSIFAVRDIFAGEEITFDYSGGTPVQATTDLRDGKECFCGSENCSKFLPFDKSLC